MGVQFSGDWRIFSKLTLFWTWLPRQVPLFPILGATLGFLLASLAVSHNGLLLFSINNSYSTLHTLCAQKPIALIWFKFGLEIFNFFSLPPPYLTPEFHHAGDLVVLCDPDLCICLPVTVLPAQFASYQKKRAKSNSAGAAKKTQKGKGQVDSKNDGQTQDHWVEPPPPSVDTAALEGKTSSEVKLAKVLLWKLCANVYIYFLNMSYLVSHVYPVFILWMLFMYTYTLENWVTNHHVACKACCHSNLIRINWSIICFFSFSPTCRFLSCFCSVYMKCTFNTEFVPNVLLKFICCFFFFLDWRLKLWEIRKPAEWPTRGSVLHSGGKPLSFGGPERRGACCTHWEGAAQGIQYKWLDLQDSWSLETYIFQFWVL